MLALEPTRAAVWQSSFASLPANVEHWADILTHDERSRAYRKRTARDQQIALWTRVLTRTVVAGYLGCAPRDVVFTAGTWGKPAVRQMHPTVHFNISHTAQRVFIACARQPVGIDVEERHPTDDLPAIVHSMGTVAEQEAFAAIDHQHYERAFFRWWTTKEALLKASGLGLHLPLTSFDVLIDRHECEARWVSRTPALNPKAWRLHTLSTDEDPYCVVLATSSATTEYDMHTIPADLRSMS